MMMTIRNTDCDDQMYQSILDMLNDKTCNKQIKKFIKLQKSIRSATFLPESYTICARII